MHEAPARPAAPLPARPPDVRQAPEPARRPSEDPGPRQHVRAAVGLADDHDARHARHPAATTAGFVLRLTRTTVQAGNLTVFFTNHDVSDHNLWIESPGGGLERISDTVGLNDSTNKTVAVTAGTWRLFCALPGHEAMTRDVNVTA